MDNPINNQVFDTRDLIEYRDYLAEQLTDLWNNAEGAEEHQASDISDILGTSGYEFAADIKDTYAAFEEDNEDEIQEYNNIVEFCDELSTYCPDFEYGASVIHENYFTDYTEELCQDIGYISKDFPSWIEIDWEATAENVKEDYGSAEYVGDTYYIR